MFKSSYEIINRRTGNAFWATRSLRDAVDRYQDVLRPTDDFILVKFNRFGHAQTIIEPWGSVGKEQA